MDGDTSEHVSSNVHLKVTKLQVQTFEIINNFLILIFPIGVLSERFYLHTLDCSSVDVWYFSDDCVCFSLM